MGTTPKAEGAPRSRVSMLEEEGEVAADYLEELLDIADLDGDIEIDVEHGRAALPSSLTTTRLLRSSWDATAIRSRRFRN